MINRRFMLVRLPLCHSQPFEVSTSHLQIVRYCIYMAEYQITFWRMIPSMIAARDGDDVVKVSLPQRFQEAIDEAAMRLDAADADAYMNGWTRTEWMEQTGTPAQIAEAVSAELDKRFSQEHLDDILDNLNA